MRQHLAAVAVLSATWIGASASADSSWIFQPSNHSHDPQSGERVEQYAMKPPAYAPSDPTYQQSGYRHNRTSLRGVGGSIDRRHYVEAWGAGEAIRPYGEWQFPFRAGATPYGPWGNPGGPWTTPFESWINPYGLGRFYPPFWPHPYHPGSGSPNEGAGGYPHQGSGHGSQGGRPWGSGGPGPGPTPGRGHAPNHGSQPPGAPGWGR